MMKKITILSSLSQIEDASENTACGLYKIDKELIVTCAPLVGMGDYFCGIVTYDLEMYLHADMFATQEEFAEFLKSQKDLKDKLDSIKEWVERGKALVTLINHMKDPINSALEMAFPYSAAQLSIAQLNSATVKLLIEKVTKLTASKERDEMFVELLAKLVEVDSRQTLTLKFPHQGVTKFSSD